MFSPAIQQNFYTVGGTVQAGGGIYLTRAADDELLEMCRANVFAYILTARQMGKSSLVVQTAERLVGEGVKSAYIDLTKIGGGKDVTAEQWYLGLLVLLKSRLKLRTDVIQWWRERTHLSHPQRFTDFVEQVLLTEVSEPVVIFIDEIDTTLGLDFTDDFFAAIRYFYTDRVQAPAFKRLSFVLIGVATPSDLIRNPQRTPFNIGQRVDLTDFTFEEALPLAAGLNLPPDEARQVLGWVFKWTNGHPYLTQRLCLALAEQGRSCWTEEDVDSVVAATFFGEMSEQDNNLQFVRDMLLERTPDLGGVLTTYQEIRAGIRPVRDEEQSIVKSHLKLSGIVKRAGVELQVRNRIYETVFDELWVREHLPTNWRKWFKYAAAVLLAAFLISLPAISVYAVKNNELAAKNKELERALAETRQARGNETAQRKTADANAAEAERLKQLAQANAAEAERQRQYAQSLKLSASTNIEQGRIISIPRFKRILVPPNEGYLTVFTIPQARAMLKPLAKTEKDGGTGFTIQANQNGLITVRRIQPGEYHLEISHPDYYPLTSTIVIRGGELTASLAPLAAKFATLRLSLGDQAVEDSTVTLDQQPLKLARIESGQLVFEHIPVGWHILKVSKLGFSDWTQEIVIRSGDNFFSPR